MAVQKQQNLHWYRMLIRLYPKSYRRQYGMEMYHTLQDMYACASTPKARRQLLRRTLQDYLSSIVCQRFGATEHSFSNAPSTVKRDALIGASLVVPFLMFVLYNLLSDAFHHPIALWFVEERTWTIYSIFLPALALLQSIKICLGGTLGYAVRREWRKLAYSFFHDWLFLGVIIAGLAVVEIV